MPYPAQPGYVPTAQAPVAPINPPIQSEPERKTWGKMFWKKFGLRIKWFAALVIFRFVGQFIVDIFFNLGFRIQRIATSIASIGGIVIGIWFVIIVFKRIMGADENESSPQNTTYVVMNSNNPNPTVVPNNTINMDQIPSQQQPTQNPQ